MPKPRVDYFYDDEIGNFYYSGGHPMKPIRVRMTHALILSYGLHKKLNVFRPRRALPIDMMRFHSREYIKFLMDLPTVESNNENFLKYGFCDDCPAFSNLFEYCQISAGGSISAAQRLNYGLCDIAINWAGGLHHARKEQASGFCYVADCVLGIMELLKYHPRVMYIDIDIHHGDGVEEAFYNSDRVLTVSFHKYASDFFPGTGHVFDVGNSLGKNYAVNVPLRDGITDDAYLGIFKPIIKRLIDWYRPSAILLQCGADSLVGDRLGSFNLSTYGHGACVAYVKSFGIPLLVCGGGGYTKTSVARCWTYETSILVNEEIPNELPEKADYFSFYKPTFKLHLTPEKMKNLNTPEYLENLYKYVLENIRHIPGSPSTEMNELPPRETIFQAIEGRNTQLSIYQGYLSSLNNNDEAFEEY